MATNPQGVVTEDQAASQIDSLLSVDPDYVDEEPEKESEKPVEVKAEVKAEEESEEEEKPETESESEEVEFDFDQKMFEVEETLLDGNKETKKYSLNELKSQRMLQADYTRKTQEVAKERAEVNEQLQKGINEQRQEYLKALDTNQQLLLQMVVPESQNLDQLAEDDPAEYIKVQNRLNRINETYRKIEEQKAAEAQKYQEYLRTEVIPKELELTKRVVPEWSDDLKPALIETGKRYGFSDEEMGTVMDHRIIHLLHEHARLTKLEASLKDSKDISQKKVVAKPKVVKSGTREKQDSGGEAFRKAQKTGRFQDAADVIAQRLDDV
jgi:hypothetical protein